MFLVLPETVSEWVNSFIERVKWQIEEHVLRGNSCRVKIIDGLLVAVTVGRNDSVGAAKNVIVPQCLRKVRWSPNINNVKDKCFIESITYCRAHQDNSKKMLFWKVNYWKFCWRIQFELWRIPFAIWIQIFYCVQKEKPSLCASSVSSWRYSNCCCALCKSIRWTTTWSPPSICFPWNNTHFTCTFDRSTLFVAWYGTWTNPFVYLYIIVRVFVYYPKWILPKRISLRERI